MGSDDAGVMRSSLYAYGLIAVLMLAGAGFAAVGSAPRAPEPGAADAMAAMPGMASSMHHGMGGAYPWNGGSGEIPTLTDAMTKLERRSSIVISGDKGFNPANGVRSGKGTFSDPYVISGYYVDTVLVKDTSRAFIFSGNYVSSILILDWTGQGGYVHHNHLENFRTNRNDARTGDATAAVIENNDILRIEQLRHFDGEVRNNTIGSQQLLLLPIEARGNGNGVTFDIAGLNGAGIHDNQIFGGVDMKLHGHHHSDEPGLQSHNHGTPNATDAYEPGVVHNVRYVDFEFYNNHIVDNGFGLRYNDLNHAGDDRQATSEQEPALDQPHVHHTTIRIHDNVIDGSTLRIATVDSLDERHLSGETATLEIADNKLTNPVGGDALQVQDVHNATVILRGNTIAAPRATVASPIQSTVGAAAILLQRFWNTTVLVQSNDMGAYTYGVEARQFDNRTYWSVVGNSGPVQHPLYYDSSVKNAPDDGAPAPAEDAHQHGHESDSAAPATPTAKGALASTLA